MKKKKKKKKSFFCHGLQLYVFYTRLVPVYDNVAGSVVGRLAIKSTYVSRIRISSLNNSTLHATLMVYV